MNKLKILHNVTSVGMSSYGLGQISVNLARAQFKHEHEVQVWCQSKKEEILWASNSNDFPLELIRGFKLFGPKKFLFSLEMNNELKKIKKDQFNIVHQHGIWGFNSCLTHKCSNDLGIQTVIAPHGSLSQYALNISKLKKKIALNTYERNNLKLASCLHATSEYEISDFRNFGLKNPIAYIENGIQERCISIVGNGDEFRELNEIPKNKRILLYLSRITQKKGLLMLVNTIKSIENDFTEWQLIIAGNDENGHKKEVETLIENLNLQKSIKIIGPQFNEDKNDAFDASELFILPSYSEGSPMVILDSLAAGVPVITTMASSWSDLNTYNCGWWTEIDQQKLTIVLRCAVNKTISDLKLMGERGRDLIASKYLWPEIAKKTINLYSWLLKQNNKPDFVIID